MAKTKVSQFDATASNNTDINSVNVAEGCPPSGINNAIREMASLLKKQEVGTDAMTSPDIDGGTIDGATIGASSASTGAFTNLSVSGAFTSQGIDDNADATAITIDSSENVAIGGTTGITAGGSPSLTVGGGSGNPSINLYGQTSSTTQINFADATSGTGAYEGFILYGHDDNRMTFGTNHAERMRITSSGNVGIGTTSPTGKLEINGSDNALFAMRTTGDTASQVMGTQYLNNSGAVTAQTFATGDSSSSSVFRIKAIGAIDLIGGDIGVTGASPDLRIDSSGNVGIGTSSPSSFYSLADNLVVGTGSGGHGLTIYSGSSDSGYIGFNDTASASMQGFIQYNHNGDYMAFAPNGSEKMRIDSSGNVGIGTTSMTTGLELHGATANACTFKLRDTGDFSSGTGPVIAFQGKDSAESFTNFAQISGLSVSSDNGMLKFETRLSGSLNEAMRIQADGTLCVGVTGDTDAKIYASRGDAGNTIFIESSSSATSGVRAISTSLNQNSNNSNCQHLRATTQNISTFRLDGNGTSTFSSDERLKKNIETTRDGYLEDLAKLRVVKYNWHDADVSTDKELGLIAQEVQKVFPKLVVEDDEELNGIEKPLALKVSVLPMMLLKALQEANTKITALEARITTLEGA